MTKETKKLIKKYSCKNKHGDIEKKIWELYKPQAQKEFDDFFKKVLKEYLTNSKIGVI